MPKIQFFKIPQSPKLHICSRNPLLGPFVL